jgi:hypothetical protein
LVKKPVPCTLISFLTSCANVAIDKSSTAAKTVTTNRFMFVLVSREMDFVNCVAKNLT